MKKLLIGLLLVAATGYSQSSIQFSVLQDANLAINGAYDTSTSGTLDMLFRLKLEGKQTKYGYLIVLPEVEYAKLLPVEYYRYSFGAGWQFTNFRWDAISTGLYVTYGFIIRDNLSTSSWGLNGEVNLRVFKGVNLIALGQLIERSDLGLYGLGGGTEIKFSGFLGLQIKLTK